MIKRDLILIDYQTPISDYAMEHDRAVLAIATNGGKTEIAIDVIGRYLKLYPQKRVLVLAHSTIILKTNFKERLDELNVSFSYSDTFDKKAQVHITLPNSENKFGNKYDFLVVDEAHENYHADRVQRIIKKFKPTKELLLTATPYKFVGERFPNIYFLAINQIPKELFAKMFVELVAVNYHWKNNLRRHTNLELDGKTKFSFKDNKEGVDAVIEKLIDRLKYKQSAETFNNPSLFNKVKNIPNVFNELGKTLWVCKSIKQAKDIYKILQGMNVNSALSESESDLNSVEINNFKNGLYDVLVVVNRAKIGYSDVNLMNIVDMSGTHNPNIIYQMIGRALRGNPTQEKYYLKITTQEVNMMALTTACVCAALMLTDCKWLSEFNGVNFRKIIIPVLKRTIKNHVETNPAEIIRKKTSRFVFPEFTHDVIDLFKDIVPNLNEPASIYKGITVGEICDELLLITEKWTKEKIIETLYYNSFTEWRKCEPKAYSAAKRLGFTHEEICKKTNWTYVKTHSFIRIWTKEKCIEKAKKYKSRNEWVINSISSYSAARKKKWLNECCKHMTKIQKQHGYWTKELCIEEAKKIKTGVEWVNKSGGSYNAARRKGWYKECRKHFKLKIK